MDVAQTDDVVPADSVGGGAPAVRFWDRFELLGDIGEGSVATVYLARDKVADRGVAVKLLKPEGRTDRTLFERFRQEADLLRSMEHPFVVGLIAQDLWGERPAFAMELAERGSLARVMFQEPTPSVQHVLTWCLDILDALDHIHRLGVVHRDVKPDNILIAGDGTARLTDFGIALRPGNALTQFGSVLGTPTFMPPEQAHDPHGAGPPADLYALGATIYVILARRPAVQLVASHMRETSLNELPDLVRPIVDAATAPAIEARFLDALEMHAEVERALADLGGARRF